MCLDATSAVSLALFVTSPTTGRRTAGRPALKPGNSLALGLSLLVSIAITFAAVSGTAVAQDAPAAPSVQEPAEKPATGETAAKADEAPKAEPTPPDESTKEPPVIAAEPDPTVAGGEPKPTGAEIVRASQARPGGGCGFW